MKHSQQSYALIDSGRGEKLERFGPYTLRRPCAQAVWQPQHGPIDAWPAHASFSREGEMGWSGKALPESWVCSVQGLSLQLKPTDFGHVGVFPEHQEAWKWLEKHSRPGIRVLNLFAYSGVASLIAARAGAEVCHVDSSSGMVRWARENAAANQLEDAPIRWIVDDARKFLARELRRERQYELILLDPPSFGRGKKGEVFKIEDELTQLLADCVKLLAPKNAGLFLSCHTPGMTPIVLEHLLRQSAMGRSPTLESGEMLLPGSQGVFSIPSGAYARWHD